jgi:hypothetical protein
VRTRRLVPWLLTIGIALITFAWVWQRLEEAGRQAGRHYLKPDSVADEPRDTLMARIRASWVPGDRLRAVLGAVGVVLGAVGAWRAWRSEGLPPRTLRRVGLSLGIVGIACLTLALFRLKTHPRDPGAWTMVSGTETGHGSVQVDGIDAPAGVVPLFAVGAAFVALAVLSAVAARIVADRQRGGSGATAVR